MTNVICTIKAVKAPAQQLQHTRVLHPDSPLHYLLPLCRPQQRQLLEQGSDVTNVTIVHRAAKQADFSQAFLVKSQAQPVIKRLRTHIRVSSHEWQSPYLIDFREYLNFGGLWLICTDAEQHFVWKHAHRRGFE